MVKAKLVITMIFIIAVIALIGGVKLGRRTYYLFYQIGNAGLCTAPTYVQYTTNIADAEDFTPITQNYYYTTAVWASCPYTIIYKATIETTI